MRGGGDEAQFRSLMSGQLSPGLRIRVQQAFQSTATNSSWLRDGEASGHPVDPSAEKSLGRGDLKQEEIYSLEGHWGTLQALEGVCGWRGHLEPGTPHSRKSSSSAPLGSTCHFHSLRWLPP